MQAKEQTVAAAPLRLVNGAVALKPRSGRRPVVVEAPAWRVRSEVEQPAKGAMAGDDPRWLLARRVFEQLQGGRAAILPPESRTRLNELGKRLGLRLFDVSLVIAIVQDHARVAGGEDSWASLMARLRMIPPPGRIAEAREAGQGSVWPWAIVAVAGAVVMMLVGAAWIVG